MKLWQKVNNLCGCGSKSRVIVEHLNQASKWVVSSLPEKFLWSVSNTSDAIEDALGSGIAYDKILAVYRDKASGGKRVAKEVPDSLAYAFESSSGSLLSATELFPKYYKLEGKIFIKPDPNSTDKGYVVFSAPPLVDENTDTWVLAEWENIVLMYAGSLDYLRQSESNQTLAATELGTVSTLLSSYSTSIPVYSPPSEPSLPTYSLTGTLPTLTLPVYSFSSTINEITYTSPSSALPIGVTVGTSLPNLSLPVHSVSDSLIEDALAKAQKLVDDGANMGGNSAAATASAQAFLNDEDSEMVQANIAIASQEVQRASGEVQKEKIHLDNYTQEVQKLIGEFSQNVAKYQADLQAVSQDAQTKLATYQAEQQDAIQSLQSQVADIQKYSAEKDTAVQEYTSKVQSVVGEFEANLNKYVQNNTLGVQKYQADVSKLLQDYQAKVQANTASFTNSLAAAKKHIEQAQMRLQTSQGYTQFSQQDFQKASTLYQWAVAELSAATGAQSAPPQQQAAQRSEEQRSTQ